MTPDFVTVTNGSVHLRVAVAGEGPLVLFVHGFPGLWYSWRHQIARFAAAGYRAAALDVRGYGGSSKPSDIASYRTRDMVSDLSAVIDALGGGRAFVAGDDWGAVLAWYLALLAPERVAAVAGLSIPYLPPGPVSFLELARKALRGRFFYQHFFLEEGVAEEKLAQDVDETLRRFLFSGKDVEAFGHWLQTPPLSKGDGAGSGRLPCPPWMDEADLAVFVEAFSKGGFRGPLNRYRAQALDVDDLRPWYGQPLRVPACFIAGEDDLFRHVISGYDLFSNPGFACRDFRGAVLLPGVGHWVQQEAPERVFSLHTQFFAGAATGEV